MFAIKVESSFLLRGHNVIAIGGGASGVYTPGETLVNYDDPSEKYNTKGLILVNYNAEQVPANWIDLQVIAEDYSAEDLLGKYLISFEE